MKKKPNPEKEEIFLKDIPLKTYAQTIQVVQPIQMTWKPKEDITPYELALCIPYIIRFFVCLLKLTNHYRILDTLK